jgi:arylformamidase
MAVYDLTHPLGARTPVFPGDDPVVVHTVADLARGDPYGALRLEIGTHSGTHVDAPAHLIPGGLRLDQIPLDLWIGPALLEDVQALEPSGLGSCRRLLLAGCPRGLSTELGRALLRSRVALLGIDGPSFDPVESSELPCHRALLGAGVVLVENLRLEGIPRGPGMLYCLPLAVEGGDGAPARVLWEPR